MGIFKESYSDPSFPYFVGGGVVLYVLGRQLYKSLKPKEYNLNGEWNYQVIKK